MVMKRKDQSRVTIELKLHWYSEDVTGTKTIVPILCSFFSETSFRLPSPFSRKRTKAARYIGTSSIQLYLETIWVDRDDVLMCRATSEISGRSQPGILQGNTLSRIPATICKRHHTQYPHPFCPRVTLTLLYHIQTRPHHRAPMHFMAIRVDNILARPPLFLSQRS